MATLIFPPKNLAAGILLMAASSSLGALQAKDMSQRLKTRQPKRALVVWYSQTGNTRRYGQVISQAWQRRGLKVDSMDIRDLHPGALGQYDVIALGTPVHYYDVPSNVKDWINSMPSIPGAAVAAFVSYGDQGGNAKNSAVALLELLVKKGGVPFGVAWFGNMGAYPPSWISATGIGNALKYSHFPDAETYTKVGSYAASVLSNIEKGNVVDAEGEMDFRHLIKGAPARAICKALTRKHSIDKSRCTGCGMCRKVCPVSAIDPSRGAVDANRCLLCYGCINNCPSRAIDMEFMGKKLYGFEEFLKRNQITIREPS